MNSRVLLLQLILGHRGALASVSCGGHTAKDCRSCSQGKGAAFCNGECRWRTTRLNTSYCNDCMVESCTSGETQSDDLPLAPLCNSIANVDEQLCLNSCGICVVCALLGMFCSASVRKVKHVEGVSIMHRRITLAVVNVAGLLGTLLMMQRSFLARHAFPYAPVIPSLSRYAIAVGAWQRMVFFMIVPSLLLLIGAGLISCTARDTTSISRWSITCMPRAASMALLLMLSLAFADQGQWQPFFLYFSAALLALSWPPVFNDTAGGITDIAPVLSLFLGFQYIYSGLTKLNPCFVKGRVAHNLLPLQLQRVEIPYEEQCAALFEALLGLVWVYGGSMWKFSAGILLATMHAFLLWRLTMSCGNPQVWPWNACCLMSVLLLSVPLARTKPSPNAPLQKCSQRALVYTPQWAAKAVMWILFGLAPALHLLGFDWDSYASFSNWSMEIETVQMRLAPSPQPLSSASFSELACSMVDADGFLDYDGWFKVSHGFYLYPAPRLFLVHGQWLASFLGVDVDVAVSGRPGNVVAATFASFFLPSPARDPEVVSVNRYRCTTAGCLLSPCSGMPDLIEQCGVEKLSNWLRCEHEAGVPGDNATFGWTSAIPQVIFITVYAGALVVVYLAFSGKVPQARTRVLVNDDKAYL